MFRNVTLKCLTEVGKIHLCCTKGKMNLFCDINKMLNYIILHLHSLYVYDMI